MVRVKPRDSPLILLTVFDVVGDLDRVGIAKQALLGLVDGAGSRPWVGVLSSKAGLTVVQAPTRNAKRLTAAIDAVNTAGYAALLDSLEDAAGIASKMIAESGVRVAVLYVTDGSIYEYRADYTSTVINPSDRSDLSRRFRDRVILDRIAKIESALHASSAPVFILHLEERTDDLNQVYQGGLQRFAAATGGAVEFCRSTADVAPLFTRLVADAGSFALVTLEPPPSVKRRARVNLRIAGGDTWIYPAERALPASE